jgi:hypothetical protein
MYVHDCTSNGSAMSVSGHASLSDTCWLMKTRPVGEISIMISVPRRFSAGDDTSIAWSQ